MKMLLNILWLILAGLWLAVGYVIAAVLMGITIIGIPFAKQALKLAGYALSTRDLTRRLADAAISVEAASGKMPTSAIS
jgi:uncharacterized membrane protein YccF (DUF307 family)